MHSCTLDTLLVYLTDCCFVECDKLKNNYTDIKNSKTDTVNMKNNLIDRAVFECLNCNEIDLYSDTAQITVFCF